MQPLGGPSPTYLSAGRILKTIHLSTHTPVPFSPSWTSKQVKREILVEVLTKRKTITANDKLILPYSLSEVSTALGSHGAPGPKLWLGVGALKTASLDSLFPFFKVTEEGALGWPCRLSI